MCIKKKEFNYKQNIILFESKLLINYNSIVRPKHINHVNLIY